MDYAQAQKIFETSRKRKLANNTYLEKNTDGSYAIRLHSTQVIKFYPEKTVLYSGGYRTVTTKARLNEFTEFSVWQKAGIWYIAARVVSAPEIVFADGITYHKNTGWQDVGENPKKISKLRKQAKQYAKDFVIALFAGKVPKPGNGDCWYCLMFDNANSEHNAGMGNRSHIISHIKEKYYVPSLLVNAVKIFDISRAAEDCIARLWSNEQPAEFFTDIGKQQIESSVRRYCYRQLQTA